VKKTVIPITSIFVMGCLVFLTGGYQSHAKSPLPTEEIISAPSVDEATTGTEMHALDGGLLVFAREAFEENCADCHEADGNAFVPKLNLVDHVWRHGGGLEDIKKIIREGVPETKMKSQREKFSDEQIDALARYILLLGKEMHAITTVSSRAEATELTDRVAPRLPLEKPGEIIESDNLIDRYILGKMKQDGIPHAGRSSDNEFVRRIYLDLWGRLPDMADVLKFVGDPDPGKRDKLIDRLLGLNFMEKPGNEDYKGPWLVEAPFLSRWGYFFGDLFRNSGQGNEGHFRGYIKQFLKFNLPYDYVVRDMLTTTAIHNSISGASGFLIRHEVDGLRCADVMHEDTCDEIAMYSTKLFLGVNLECVSCHDGAGHLDNINLWLSQRKRVEFWRQAAFFGNLRIIRPGLSGQEFTLLEGRALRPENIWQGKIANHEFTTTPNEQGGMGYRMEAPSVLRVKRDPTVEVYPEFVLTKERPSDPRYQRHEYARMLTSSFQFAKATANLIWAQFMTVGIVDPPLDWDLARQDPQNPPPAPWTIQPTHPELLDELGRYFIENNYDLRLMMQLICQSQAYQMSSRFEGEYKPEYDRYYARKLVKRLSAEEIYDAIVKATNVFGGGVKYAQEQAGPAGDEQVKRFLDFFGQSNRKTKEASRKGSIIQASLMLNSDLIKNKVMASTEGSTVNTLLKQEPMESNEDLVQQLYLRTLSRRPSEGELVTAAKHIEKYRNKGVEDLQWALINKLEFIVNY
jgi:cytochrome c553